MNYHLPLRYLPTNYIIRAALLLQVDTEDICGDKTLVFTACSTESIILLLMQIIDEHKGFSEISPE